MRSVRSGHLPLLVAAALAVAGRGVEGQTPSSQPAATVRALEHETAGRLREAIAAYREALGEGAVVPAILGLERVYAQLGRSDSILPLVDSLITRRPRDATLRTVQLRTLNGMRRDDLALTAFERWVIVVPRDAAPYREYARLLLDDGRTASADSVLQRATRALGTSKDFTLELAQLRSAMGLWEPSAKSWREAVRSAGYLEQAAVFALHPAPVASRPDIRAILLAPPVEIGARRVLASLELRWRSAREGWSALQSLAPSDSAVAAWVEFAGQAEDAEAWLVARDALAAAHAKKPSPELAIRAANDAMNGGDAASALELVSTVGATRDSVNARTVLPIQLRALSALGRALEAEQLLASYDSLLDVETRAYNTRTIAWGWVRAGDLTKARAALAAAGADQDDRTAGWIALYSGDLRTARRTLRKSVETSADLVLALSLLSRTKVDSAPVVGSAFLALTRGDSVQAAERFVESVSELADAAPLVQAAAARLFASRGDAARSLELWQSLVERHAAAPEAAEAELEWAKSLRRSGDAAQAIARLEHLILTYPRSALVPQARRELELARNSVPTPP